MGTLPVFHAKEDRSRKSLKERKRHEVRIRTEQVHRRGHRTIEVRLGISEFMGSAIIHLERHYSGDFVEIHTSRLSVRFVMVRAALKVE